MSLVGCFVTPHPPIIIPEIGGARIREAEPTARSMRVVEERAAELEPETIVLLSPHAPLALHRMGVSLASSYHGSFAYFRAPQVKVQVQGDQGLARVIMEAAGAHGVPVVATASDAEVVDLDHGAMVPLVFLLGGLKTPCKLVLLSFSQLSIDEHVRYGKVLGQALINAPQRIVYVASGDMSHRLMPEAPNGYDPRGPQFDRAVAEAFAKGDWDGLISIPPTVVSGAGECGFRSLAVLRGLVSAVEEAGTTTKNCLLSYEGPFGVGYLVGEVEFLQQSQG